MIQLANTIKKCIFIKATALVFFCQFTIAQPVKKIADVKKIYLQIASKNKADVKLVEQCWQQVSDLYSDSSRHYHTLQHLANFYNELLRCEKELNNWELAFLSMVYHDVVYVAVSRDNEEKSAEMAADHLQKLGFSVGFIDTSRQLIMATKSHKATGDLTTDLFIDADMSILGVPLEQYKQYAQQVNKEYAVVPDFATKRKGFLKHFLETERLFITPLFYNLYEVTARNNLQKEIDDFK